MTSSWANSNRKAELPTGWARLRQATASRAGYQCEATMRDGTRCTEPGTDCDHINGRHNHNLSNLQWLCRWHHDKKTAHEAAQGRRGTARGSSKKPAERHPGLK